MNDKAISLERLCDDPGIQTLFSALGEGIVVSDHAGRVLYLNQQAEEILGCRLAQIKGRNMHDCHQRPWKVEEVLMHHGATNPYRGDVQVGDRWLTVTATGPSAVAMLTATESPRVSVCVHHSKTSYVPEGCDANCQV